MTSRPTTARALALLLALAGCPPGAPGEDGGPDGSHDAGADGDDGGGDPPGPLRVMTWNLETFPKTSETVSVVAGLLEELDVDVLAVQEVAQPDGFDRLLQALPGWDGLLNDDPGAYIRVGLLYRESRVELLQSATLFEDDWYAFPRPPLLASLRARGDREPFDFVAIVLHLKASTDDESRARRRAACERLEEWIADRVSGGAEDDYVVLGDWNDELTDRGELLVFDAFLDRPGSYTFLTLDLAEAGAYSYVPFRSFLDHVLVTASALEEYGRGETEVLALETTVPRYLDAISDHRPVLSVFEVP